MGDEEQTTLDGQFLAFAKFLETKDNPRDGSTIDLWRSDYWMRQAKILDGKCLNTTDTGTHFYKLDMALQSEMDWGKWLFYLAELCTDKKLDQDDIEEQLKNCGLPGSVKIVIPKFKELFEACLIKEEEEDD